MNKLRLSPRYIIDHVINTLLNNLYSLDVVVVLMLIFYSQDVVIIF